MSNADYPAELWCINATRRCGVCILPLVTALCVACEQQHLHASLDLPFNTYPMCHTVCADSGMLSSNKHVKRQALPILSSSFVSLQVIDQVVRTCPIDCRRPLYNNIVLSVSHLPLTIVS